MPDHTPPQDSSYFPPRAFPRVPLHSPVEVKTASRLFIGQIENISIGGLLVSSDPPPAIASELQLLFNLAAGRTVSAAAVVRHATKSTFGVQFHDLAPAAQEAITDYCETNLGHVRRSGRVPKRLLVTLRGKRKEDQDELAETVMLSRNGGLLACRARFKAGNHLELFWPEKKRHAEIEIVSSHAAATGLLELGFQFLNPDFDFWELDFPKLS
ncbi:MAG TPA: PilZ domain-containing protein [Terriglobales bacterium]|nr:PilZ domain-containing protein [Terriglobales bacterium]